MIWCTNASSVWIRLIVAWNFFSVCSWIYQTGALWHPILWKPRQIRLWISHLHLWIYDSLMCGSHKLGHFSQLRCCVNIWRYQKNFITNSTVNYISCVDEGPIKISNLLHGSPMGKGLGTSPVHFSSNLALQSSPTSTVTQLAVYAKVMNGPSVIIDWLIN